MASYDERERDYYEVLALSEAQSLALVERIVSALVQRRSRVPILSVVHWLPNEWQCLDDPAAIDFFHGAIERERGENDVSDDTRRIERLDFSAALGGNERDYHRAMAMLDFLDVRFYCSYITRTVGTVYIKPQRKPAVHRGLFDWIGDVVHGRGTAWRVVEYRIVLDLVLTMFARRENALQLASAMRYGVAASESGAARKRELADPQAQAQAQAHAHAQTKGVLSGSNSIRSRSDSINVRSAASAHSSERTSVTMSMSERSRSPNMSVRVSGALSRSASDASFPVNAESASGSASASGSGSSSSTPSVELLEPRSSPPPGPRARASAQPAPSSAPSGPARRVIMRQPIIRQWRSRPLIDNTQQVKEEED